MNRYGYLAENVRPYNNFGYNMDDLSSQFGYLNFGSYESSDDEDEHDFGYSHFGYGLNDSDSDSDSDDDDDSDENDFGYSHFGYDDNEFGKKMRRVNANAKKAMRLAHSEGISLKEAWKRVKGQSSGRKTTRKKTTAGRKTTAKKGGRRKANADAKKAMKLKHQRGITLKQAWKIVKKERR